MTTAQGRAPVGPARLRHDNVTPVTRTPWGGRRIATRIKRGLDLSAVARDVDGVDVDGGAAARIGESWEVSVEPSFPSRLADGDALLADVIAADPVAWLGADLAARLGQTPLLVKLLDTDDALSVQVHPTTGDPALGAGDSGKPEGWYVIGAEPGAGLYLGFADGVERDDVAACLARGGRLDALMNFVPVAPGDAFAIDAGTVHAIGPGVTLVEPQYVEPGRRGVTYRFWDWNRRYDDAGRRSDTGRPRPLHVERSLAVTRWGGPRGADAVSVCRTHPQRLRGGADGDARRTQIIDWRWFAVEVWSGTGALAVAAADAMLAAVCVAGRCAIETEAGACAVRAGQSMVIPAAAGAVRAQLAGAQVVVTRSA